MFIKNVGFSMSGASGNYNAKKMDKTDISCRAGEPDSSFANQLKTYSNSVDTIEISQRTVDNGPVLSQVRNQICSEIRQDADPDRLSSLKDLIQAGQYSIQATEVAKMMLLN